MDVQLWTWILVGISFTLYFGIAIWARASSTKDFYIAGGGVSPLANGMATAADWMSAASFISMAGLISFSGYDGSVYLMGWTGGYVLLALLLAPYLRKFGKFTVPDFIGDRYYSNSARTIAIICALIVSFTYVAGQMRGVGIVFSQFLQVDITKGVLIGMAVVLVFAFLGGMKGITYTQVAQYCVLIFAFMVPAIFISIQMTGNPFPQIGMGDKVEDGTFLLDKLDQLHTQLGFKEYTSGTKSTWDIFAITLALMAGTSGLPHVIVRFFTVPKVKDARKSAGYALLLIAILYTTAPAIAVFARTNLITKVNETAYKDLPDWFKNWENTGLISWTDKNKDGKIQYRNSEAVDGKPLFTDKRGANGERIISNPSAAENELYVDKDIMVLANPEIAQLPNWVIGLVAAGGLAAALSTAAGLLLVISTSVSHDLVKKQLKPNISDKGELMIARISILVAIIVAGFFG
ncbi:MAG: cation acetate symporter, partial [Zunongwangia sp.]|nr:cation acetate symporter [Zunongwangia sp.]